MVRRRMHTILAGLAVLLLTALGGGNAAYAASVCVEYGDLIAGSRYVVGDTFTSAGAPHHVRQFQWADGTWTADGYVEVVTGNLAGGSGQELQINNANVTLDVGPSPGLLVDGLTLKFGEYGGNLNISINGDFRNVANLADIHGATMGGVVVAVVNGSGNDAGTLTLTGSVGSFTIGGQEFFIDDLCLGDPVQADAWPDLGDAPDSTNNLGIPNTAYAPAAPGRFPTVWNDTPAGSPSGPKHLNVTKEAILGLHITAEREADTPPDMDAVTNILAAGLDTANDDRADDGWLNRNAPLVNCREATLAVRVSRAAGASLNRMYLNVWFDGNRDADWADMGQCPPTDENQPVRRSFEWIVQNYPVNMGAIPAGGFSDLTVPTFLVHNVTPDQSHWLRFTLSERPVPHASGAPADGRGPQFPGAYDFGETEDYLQRVLAQDQPGEPGLLRLEKRVSVEGPIQAGTTFSYTVRLHHQGGTAAINAELGDVLPAQVRMAGRVRVRGDADKVGPLAVRMAGNRIRWQGRLAPDSDLVLEIPVRANACFGEDVRVRNVAVARPQEGDPLEASADVQLQCAQPGLENVELIQELVYPEAGTETGAGDGSEIAAALAGQDAPQPPAVIVPGSRALLRQTVRNRGEEALRLALNFEEIKVMAVAGESGEIVAAAGATEGEPATRRRQLMVSLGPGEAQTFDLPLDLSMPRLADLDQDLEAESILVACQVTGDTVECPAEETGQSKRHSFRFRIHPRDLGDAPDSTNHWGAAMRAYPGVAAAFPVTFDPALAGPQGPVHAHPRAFHLGDRVSVEAFVDFGPDSDIVNNIVPPLDIPDRERFDDGIRPGAIPWAHCGRVEIPVKVTISPAAALYFAAKDGPAYINIWVDALRDGDWDDVLECPVSVDTPDGEGAVIDTPDGEGASKDAPEHIVIDHAVDVTALGPGVHVVTVTTGLLPWPAEKAADPAWLRVTLSERKSYKPLAGGLYGDGSVGNPPTEPGRVFRLGETEDYLWRAQGDPGSGPDAAVRKRGAVAPVYDPDAGMTYRAAKWVIEYANLGDAPATGVTLVDTMDPPARSQDLNIRTVPEIPYAVDGDTLRFRVGDLAAGRKGRVVIHMRLPDDAQSGHDYSNQVIINSDVDVNPDNNQAAADVTLGLAAPVIIDPVDGESCSGDLTVIGRAAAGSQVDLYVDDAVTTTAVADAQGHWQAAVSLADGPHTLYAVARLGDQTSPPSAAKTVTVDSSLLWSPISLRFQAENGRVTRIVNREEGGWGVRLPVTGFYTLTLQVCCSEGAQVAVALSYPDNPDADLSVTLTDEDGDGLYTGRMEVTERTRDAVVSVTVLCGDTEVTASGVVLIDPEGVVFHAETGALLGNSTVACMEGRTTAAGSDSITAFDLWPAADYGQINPQTTATDAYFSFWTPPGSYQLVAGADGYQPYRSTTIQVVDELVRYDIPLAPAINDPADHVVTVDGDGFSPAYLMVTPGSVVEFVNMGLAEHTASSDSPALTAPSDAGQGWDSGLLASGESFKVRLDSEGAFRYVDRTNGANQATIVVQAAQVFEQLQLFLPVTSR